MNLPNPFGTPEYTEAERLEEALHDGLDGAYEHADAESKMWYCLGYAAGVTRREEERDDE